MSFGVPLGVSWGPFGLPWVTFGVSWGPFGLPWVPFGTDLFDFGAIWASICADFKDFYVFLPNCQHLLAQGSGLECFFED